jgi:hypothetical protein
MKDIPLIDGASTMYTSISQEHYRILKLEFVEFLRDYPAIFDKVIQEYPKYEGAEWGIDYGAFYKLVVEHSQYRDLGYFKNLHEGYYGLLEWAMENPEIMEFLLL